MRKVLLFCNAALKGVTPLVSLVMTVWSIPAPSPIRDLLDTVTGLVQVAEPAGICTVSPLLAELSAAWTSACEGLAAAMVAAGSLAPEIRMLPRSNRPKMVDRGNMSNL